LDIPNEIVEKPDAVVLPPVKGAITFDNVTFSYVRDEDEQPAGLGEVIRFNRRSSEQLLKRGRQRENGQTNGSGEAIPATPAAPRLALDNVSFNIEQGQLVALVGPSGAGKTTITYPLPRLYDPGDGRVLLDGHDLRDVTLRSLADNIGMVTQDTYLFYDTVRANLLYA